MKELGKQLIVKEWFHVNKMNELKKNVQSNEVYAILKETEKAYNVLVGASTKTMTYWVPKSQVEEAELIDGKRGTITDVTYDEAWKDWNSEMSFYR